jgi:hypothetical protein
MRMICVPSPPVRPHPPRVRTRRQGRSSLRATGGPRARPVLSRVHIRRLERVLHTDSGVLLAGVEILRVEHGTAHFGRAADNHRVPERDAITLLKQLPAQAPRGSPMPTPPPNSTCPWPPLGRTYQGCWSSSTRKTGSRSRCWSKTPPPAARTTPADDGFLVRSGHRSQTAGGEHVRVLVVGVAGCQVQDRLAHQFGSHHRALAGAVSGRVHRADGGDWGQLRQQ